MSDWSDLPEDMMDRMPMPHCDQKIMHAPGVCEYCDKYPEAQALRLWWGINFTGEHELNKAECPSNYHRTDEMRDLWAGEHAGGIPVSDEYTPACGNIEPHSWHDHVTMDIHFKESRVWCGGMCACRCSCADHRGLRHGPGDHK